MRIITVVFLRVADVGWGWSVACDAVLLSWLVVEKISCWDSHGLVGSTIVISFCSDHLNVPKLGYSHSQGKLHKFNTKDNYIQHLQWQKETAFCIHVLTHSLGFLHIFHKEHKLFWQTIFNKPTFLYNGHGFYFLWGKTFLQRNLDILKASS
jgi:hypothetical protein